MYNSRECACLCIQRQLPSMTFSVVKSNFKSVTTYSNKFMLRFGELLIYHADHKVFKP